MTLKAGLEIHQQLNSGKLFCNCSLSENGKDVQFKRKLHATSSELGDVDIAAKTEQIKLFTYYNKSCNCLVYTDEEPPRGPNADAVKIALQFAQLVNAEIVEEMHFMRKVVVDGSNTSGFQRTGLIATGGRIEYEGKILELDQLCLEEDSCRHGEEDHEYFGWTNVNKWMCESGYAVGYTGQNKDDVKDEHWNNRLMLAEQGVQELLQWDED